MLKIFAFFISFNVFAVTKTLNENFIYLHEIDPTIIVHLRYFSRDNFVGQKIDGYKKNVAILTKQAANALKKVQQYVSKDGYCLVVYDAYRPLKACRHFLSWSKDLSLKVKKYYYPTIDKQKLFDLGYIACKSSHSRGGTVDVTLIKKDKKLQKIKFKAKTLLGGQMIPFLDDGTIDMGCSFDLFHSVAHYDSNLIHEKQKNNREYLKTVMQKHGFKNYAKEWWHFTLQNEPFKDEYFDFDVQ